MAAENFNKIVDRTKAFKAAVTKTKSGNNIDTEKTKIVLSETLRLQTEVKEQVKVIKKDYRKNKTIYDALLNDVISLRKKRAATKFRKGLDPYDRFRKKSGRDSGGGGILGMVMMFLKPILSKFMKGVKATLKGFRKGLSRLIKTGGRLGKRGVIGAAKGVKNLAVKGFNAARNSNTVQGAKRLARGGLSKAVQMGARLTPVAVGAARHIGGFLARGVIATGAVAASTPLLISAAAAAVGYGTYKLGRYLKLSEKLDSFISKVSGGKYGGLVDFILGIANGTVGKELYGWVKTKISTMFTDAVAFIKEKTNDILGKFSPFKKETDESEEKGGDKSVVGAENASQLSANKASGDVAVTPNDTSTDSTSGSSAQSDTKMSFWDKMKASAGSVFSSAKEALTGSSDSSSDSGGGVIPGNPENLGGSNLAWHALTGGKSTTITSGYRTKSRPNHDGIDIRARTPIPIYAVEDGIFTTNTDPGGGLQGFVKAKSGYTYGVAHLSKVLVKNGQQVSKGTKIAMSGNSGLNSSAPHIHFGIRYNGQRVNPTTVTLPAVKKKADAGTGDMVWPGDASSLSVGNKSNTNITPSITNKSSNNSYNTFPTAAVSATNKSINNFMPSSDITGVDDHGLEGVAMPDILSRISNIATGKDKDYVGLAKSFSKLISDNWGPKDEENIPQSSTQNAPKPRTISQPQPAASSSKSGAIAGSTPEVQDPRGALNSQIVLACTSPLFV